MIYNEIIRHMFAVKLDICKQKRKWYYFRFKPLKHRMHRGDQEGKNKPANLDIRVGLSAYITSDDDTWSALPPDFVKNVGLLGPMLYVIP